MDNDSRIAGKIKTQITRFANKISDGFKKPTKKFVVHTVYGIQASKDVKLSNISRSLNEQTPLIKTEARLSRNIGKEDLTGIELHRFKEYGGFCAGGILFCQYPFCLQNRNNAQSRKKRR